MKNAQVENTDTELIFEGIDVHDRQSWMCHVDMIDTLDDVLILTSSRTDLFAAVAWNPQRHMWMRLQAGKLDDVRNGRRVWLTGPGNEFRNLAVFPPLIG